MWLMLILLLLTAMPVMAEDLYVRPLGTDYGAENGLAYATAWEGLSAVQWGTSAGEVGPGDTLWVCGTHINYVTANDSGQGKILCPTVTGTAANHITIKGHPDYPAIVWGAYVDQRAGGQTQVRGQGRT